MRLEKKSIILKNGAEAILRSPIRTDAQALINYMRETAGETEFLLSYPEERVMTAESEERFIETINESPLNLMILCEVNDRIAGNCHLSLNRHIKTRHRASVAIALYKEFWGLGIGTAMFREMIAAAEELGIQQLELDFIEGNERARALYEKMGFEVVAERPDAIRLKDGTMLKEYSMIRKLRKEENP